MLRQASTILLLSILVFNWIGYRFVSYIIEQSSEISLENHIAINDFDETQLMELRIPLHLPYLPDNSTEYENFQGDLDYSGVHYKYVKRKISNGFLVLLCLPNENKKRFQNSRTAFFTLVNSLNHNTQGSEKSNNCSFKSFCTDYTQDNSTWELAALIISEPVQFSRNMTVRNPDYNNIPKQPPRKYFIS